MKVFLSAIENGFPTATITKILDQIYPRKMKYNLMSFYYIRTQTDLAERIRDNTEEILIDSGAHSFQKGKKVDWISYTQEYADFIQKFDRPNVVGYFEMDVDNVLGYEKVLELRGILESVSDKIIPVWHKNRGIEEFKKMCKNYSGKIIAITGFRNEDIKDDQYLMFVKYAKKYDCKVHCLGMTRRNILDRVPFDYVDSSSWKQSAIYGQIGNRKVKREFQKNTSNYPEIYCAAYLEGMKMQEHYEKKYSRLSRSKIQSAIKN